jgi:hypothetical protein
MVLVYCDTGGYRSELKDFEQQGLIKLLNFKYENRNKYIKDIAPPSEPTYQDMHYSSLELCGMTSIDLGKKLSKKDQIIKLIGECNIRDIKHLDSAYMAGCKAFITSDKDDICSKSNEIFHLLDIHVFHFHSNWDEFVEFCHNKSSPVGYAPRTNY